MLTGRRGDVLEPLADGARRTRDRARSQRAAPSVERLVADAGDVDILVANAALPASGRLDSFSIEEIDRALDVNLRAPIVLARALAPAMVARGQRAPRVHLLARRQGDHAAAPRSTTRPSSACAASRWPCAPSCAAPASACRPYSRASFATPACSPTARSSCRPASARARPRTSPRAVVTRDRARPRRDRCRAAAAAAGRDVRRLAPELAHSVSRCSAPSRSRRWTCAAQRRAARQAPARRA